METTCLVVRVPSIGLPIKIRMSALSDRPYSDGVGEEGFCTLNAVGQMIFTPFL
jgi:hypothetical protein